MRRLVSWPMYAVDRTATGRFWMRLREALVALGLDDVPAALAEPDDLLAHWTDPALLLSQTCGFPFVTSLAGRVRYVATPSFAAPGCVGAAYRSAVIVRRDDPASTLAAMAGRRVAYNGRDSQSGYNGLRALVAPLARGGRFFGTRLETGAHRASLRAVASGAADIAAIDVVTLALLERHVPDETRDVRVLCHTAPVPGLPLVTAGGTSDEEVLRLRRAVRIACETDVARHALLLTGAEELPEDTYGVILVQRDAAGVSGYPDLA